MFDGLKDVLGVTPAKAASVSIVFWIVAAVLIYAPEDLQYMATKGQTILVVGAIGFMIPATMGIPDWYKAREVTKERKEIIRNLNRAAKDILWSMLADNRRTYTALYENLNSPQFLRQL